ncbi:MAG: hypothetical protein ABIF19_10635 [Planctomycetota bacterium]
MNSETPARIVNVAAVLVLVILSLAVLGNSMMKPVGRDEQMYCTGAVCLAQGKLIYRDFSYAAQMPYHPLLCAALYKIFNTTHYLLVGRLVSCVCDILVMVCIVGIYRRIFKSFRVYGILFGLAAAVLYVFNPLVDYANGYAWNHDVVILCVVLSFWLFVSTDFRQRSAYWRIAAMGALLTFATCMRVTTALVELLFFVMLLTMPAGSIMQRVKTALPFLAAGAVVLIWPVSVIARAPQAFFLNLVKIPMLYGRWLYEIGMVHDKLGLTLACLNTAGYRVILLMTVYLCLTGLYLRRSLKAANARGLLLAVLLVVTFFVIALIPPTMWRQYLAVPVPFMVIAFAFPLSYLREVADKAKVGKHFKIASAVTAFCVLVAVTSYPVVLYRVPVVLVPEGWGPVELHKVSADIAQKARQPGPVLTLAPLLAIEGGSEIYTELSAGAIIYRIADFLSAEERRITHTAGPDTFAPVLEASPPSAAIFGLEMRGLEEPLMKAAVKDDWEVKKYENGPTAYFRP